MYKIIISAIAAIASFLAIFLFGKNKGVAEEKQKQQEFEIENNNENDRINKKINSMSFGDKSDFLLSKQKNNIKK